MKRTMLTLVIPAILLILLLNLLGMYLASTMVFASDITDVVTAGESTEQTAAPTATPFETVTPEATEIVTQTAAAAEPTTTPTVTPSPTPTPTPTPAATSDDDTDWKTKVVQSLAVIQQFMSELRTLAYGAVVFVIVVILYKLFNWLF